MHSRKIVTVVNNHCLQISNKLLHTYQSSSYAGYVLTQTGIRMICTCYRTVMSQNYAST